MSIKWFSTASNPFKGKIRPRKAPSAPKTKAPKYKEQKPRYRGPKVRKPHVERPFSDQPMAVGHVVNADSRDASSEAIDMLKSDLDERGLDVSSISWVKSGSGNDEDGWCQRLSQKTYSSFDDLINQASRKPRKYLERDMRTGYDADGIIGVAHPGCTCYLKISVSDGSVYKITSEDPTANMISPPKKRPPVKVEPEIIEPDEETED